MARDRSECATGWAACSMSRTIYVSHRSSNLIIGLYSMSVLLYGTGVLVTHLDEPDESDELDERAERQLATPPRELFLKMELPFESNASPVYEVVMTVQFFHQLAAATIVGVLNALIVSLVSKFDSRQTDAKILKGRCSLGFCRYSSSSKMQHRARVCACKVRSM